VLLEGIGATKYPIIDMGYGKGTRCQILIKKIVTRTRTELNISEEKNRETR